LVTALTLFCASGNAVTLQKAFMAKAPSDASCNPSPQVTSFLSTDATAWLYVSVSSAAAGDVLKVEWVRPDGQVQQTSQFNPSAQAGDYCYDVHLSIAGTSAATALGTWTVRGLWNGSPLFTLTFTLVNPACTYSISPASLTFGASGGSGVVSVTAGAGCSWTAASNVSWITITSGASGSGGGTAGYTVAANTSSTSRTGTLTIAGQTHTVTQAGAAPSGPPQLSTGGVTNAADYSRDFAPGVIVSIFGTSLASTAAGASRLPLPTTLEGASVEVVDGSRTLNAPLFYVSPTQINAQLPSDLTSSSVQVRVRNAAGASGTDTITILPQAPRLFTKTMDGKGEAILFHSDNVTAVSASKPAQPGEVLVAYLTGLGAVTPGIAAGAAAGDGGGSGPLNVVAQQVSAMVDGMPVRVEWAGMVPYLAGLYQVNFHMPTMLRDGNASIVVAVGDGQSQANVYAVAKSGGNWQTVASVSLGASGGMVSGPGVAVTVPAGVLPGATTVSVARSTDSGPSNPARKSDLFFLDGLPADRAAPITITLDVPPTAGADDEPELALVLPYGALRTAPIVLHTTRNGNQVTFTLPSGGVAAASGATATAWSKADSLEPGVAAASSNTPIVRYFFYELRGLKHWTNSANITVLYDTNTVPLSRARAIGDALDNAFNLLQDTLKLSWAGKPLPIEAFIYPFSTFLYFWGDDANNPGGEGSRVFGISSQCLNLNSRFLANDGDIPAMSLTASHELFHVLQNLYDPRWGSRQATEQSKWLWMEEATAVWFERLVKPGYISDLVVAGYWNFLLGQPLEYQIGDTVARQRHGYGASMFIEYLAAQNGGPSFVGKIIAKMKTTSPATVPYPLEALRDLIPTPFSTVWLNFCQQYMAGKTYSNSALPEPLQLSAVAAQTGSFTSDTPNTVTFAGDYPDLSAQIYKVSFSGTWKANTKLTVTLTSPGSAQAIIYLMKPASWQQKQLVSTTWTVPNAEQLAADRETWVIMVANGNSNFNGSGTSHIELKVEVSSSASRNWNFPYVEADFNIGGSMQYVSGGKTVTNPAGVLSLWNGGPPTPAALLVWTGDSFTADSGQVTWLEAGDRMTEQLTVSGSVDTQHSRLVTITFKDRWFRDSTTPPCTIDTTEVVQQLTITNVALDPRYSMDNPNAPELAFRLDGAAAAANTQFVYTATARRACPGLNEDSQTTWVAGAVPADAYVTVVFRKTR
jgi:uncharacterized protein (TIGR03437 family)